jgi:tRNA-intron endonuclease
MRTRKSKKETKLQVKAVFSGETVYSNKKEAFTLYQQSRFGEQKEGKIFYSIFETLYLIEKGKMQLEQAKKKLNFDKLLALARTMDNRANTKYQVFKDMRDRGYVVKTALKFGAEFRVYDKGQHPGQEHAKWILYPVRESDSLTWHDFSAKNRVAHSTKKNLLIGIVDDEGDCTFYEIKWVKP